jgi:hypothetical protein
MHGGVGALRVATGGTRRIDDRACQGEQRGNEEAPEALRRNVPEGYKGVDAAAWGLCACDAELRGNQR